MTKLFRIALLLTFTIQFVIAQKNTEVVTIDTNYLEDQFYAGLGYNFMLNKPNGVIQRNLSYHVQLGFIKDIPLNTKRDFGLGIGVGYATNSYYSNMLALATDESITYRLPASEESFDRSKFETHSLEFPLEIRWRTSNAVDYKFWRAYVGFKLAYLFSRRSKLVSNSLTDFAAKTTFTNTDIQQWQYGLTFNFGYNTWNMHVYYALSDLLNGKATFNEEVLKIKALRLGVIFYIL